MMNYEEFFHMLKDIENAVSLINNSQNISDMVKDIKYMQTTMSKFGTLKDIIQHMDFLRHNIYVSKEFYSLDEAAEYLCVSKSYMYRMSCNNEIDLYKPKGRLIYIKRDDLNKWIERNKIESTDKIKGYGLIKAAELNRNNKL